MKENSKDRQVGYSTYINKSAPRTNKSVGKRRLKKGRHANGVSAKPFVKAIPNPVTAKPKCCD